MSLKTRKNYKTQSFRKSLTYYKRKAMSQNLFLWIPKKKSEPFSGKKKLNPFTNKPVRVCSTNLLKKLGKGEIARN